MRICIAGPRDLTVEGEVIGRAIAEAGWDVTEIIGGGADGIDADAWAYAELHDIPHRTIEAEWTRLGDKAGPIRNRRMAQLASGLIIIKRRGKKTPGTSSMMREARKAGIPIHVAEVSQ